MDATKPNRRATFGILLTPLLALAPVLLTMQCSAKAASAPAAIEGRR